MLRILTLAGALLGAAGLSQYPEFTQQYTQRLAGQVDALTAVVVDFDNSALASGLGREQALSKMTGSDFLVSRQIDMRRVFARHARLSENLMLLRMATPMERLILPHRMADPATIQAAWSDFVPAVPLSVAGAASAGVGFLGGWALVAAFINLIAAPWRYARRRGQDNPQAKRIDPPVARPASSRDKLAQRPVLHGERR